MNSIEERMAAIQARTAPLHRDLDRAISEEVRHTTTKVVPIDKLAGRRIVRPDVAPVEEHVGTDMVYMAYCALGNGADAVGIQAWLSDEFCVKADIDEVRTGMLKFRHLQGGYYD